MHAYIIQSGTPYIWLMIDLKVSYSVRCVVNLLKVMGCMYDLSFLLWSNDNIFLVAGLVVHLLGHHVWGHPSHCCLIMPKLGEIGLLKFPSPI